MARSVDTNDRRRTWITSTEKATEFRKKMVDAGLASIDYSIQGVSKDELKTAAKVLDSYISYLKSALQEEEAQDSV